MQVLQAALPPELCGSMRLPGVAPVQGNWLHVDDAYSAQMARRAEVLAEHPDQVIYGEGSPAAQEMFEVALAAAADLGFQHLGDSVRRPDGVHVHIRAPLLTLGHLFQNDFVLMEAGPDGHVLSAAVLCFPASWTLAEKAGRPLDIIHDPVEEYDDQLARRVQRLFDGVQVGRPLWRFNRLWYADAELYQPRSHAARRDIPATPSKANFVRSERQTIVRLRRTGAVVFAIHTYVVDGPTALAQLGEA